MANLASINIRFLVNLAELNTGLKNAVKIAERTGKDMQQVGIDLSKSITLPILALGAASIKSFGDLEALDKGLSSVMGSAEAAAIEFEKLREVAKLPGLGLEEAVRGSVRLQSAGFSADQARESLLAFGNALATVGKGKNELDLVILALTQLQNKSSGFGQDLRQLTEQLPQLRGVLTAAFGTADSEAISDLGVTGKEVVQLITKEFAKLPKVAGGINNAFENASDAGKIALADFGKAINKAFNIEGVINSLSQSLTDLVEVFKELSPNTQKTILGFAGVAAGIGPVLVGLGGLIRLMPLVTTAVVGLSSAFLFLPAVIAGLAAVYVAFDAYRSSVLRTTEAQRVQAREQKLSNELNAEATRMIAAQRLELDKWVLTARNTKLPLQERKEAMDAINKISPEFLGNLTLETINTDAATTAINKYNEALFKGALARAAVAKVDANALKRVEAELKYQAQTYEYNKKKNAAQAKGWAEYEKFADAENGKQARALFQYEETLRLLDAEDERLKKIVETNQDYSSLIKTTTSEVTKLGEALIKPGTIAYYEDQIKKLKEIRDGFETTRGGVAAVDERIAQLQKKIDALNGTRIKIEALQLPDAPADLSQSFGTIEWYDKQIAELRKLQTVVGVTAEAFQNLEIVIAGLELEKEVRFDLPAEEINNFSTTFTNFGQKFIAGANEINQKSKEMAIIAASVADGFANAFENMAGRFVDSLSTANDGLQGFFKGLAAVVIKIISAMLAQSLANAIGGATSAGAATGPAAIVTTPAFIASAIAGVLAAFASIPRFETGGVVGGNSFFGDKNLVRVNSGEWILNKLQQKRIMDMIEPAGGAVNITLDGAFKISGNDLELLLQRIQQRNSRNR